jgi:acyl carrier protein
MTIEIDQIMDAVKKSSNYLELDKLNETVDLSEIGVDSLDMFSILLSLQELAGIEIPDEDIDGLSNIKSIHEYFKNHM